MLKFQPVLGDPLADMTISVGKVGAINVVRLRSPQLIDLQSELMGRHLNDVATRSGGRLVVDLTDVERFSCCWVNELVGLTARCQDMGGRLVVFGIRVEAMQVLRHAGLGRRLNLAEDEREAVDFAARRSASSWRLMIARALALPVARPTERLSKAA